jgi:hypothetical protein
MLDLNSLIVKSAAPAEPAQPAAPPVETAAAPAKPAGSAPPEMFRTSVYFSRAVHDKLREIAFEERKSVTDLINEGLDHVLAARSYPTTAELRTRKK